MAWSSVDDPCEGTAMLGAERLAVNAIKAAENRAPDIERQQASLPRSTQHHVTCQAPTGRPRGD